ncbi:MAG: hypothetical protein PHV39_10260 [Methanomicrobium sp.]|nr:hypothetical protein [Methanomicrobium sp.]
MSKNHERKKVLLAGMFLLILILSFSFLFVNYQNSPDLCLPPPTPIFWLVNKDINQSHYVSVIINDASNTTLTRESYSLSPRESTKSEFMMTSETTTTTNPYYLIFTVDDSMSSEIPVNVSYYRIPNLYIDPASGEVVLYPDVFTVDYGCSLS